MPERSRRTVERVGGRGELVTAASLNHPSRRASAVQQGLIHPGMGVDAVAVGRIDEVLEACAVPRYLVRVVRLDCGHQTLLSFRDLYLQFLAHELISLRAPLSPDGEPRCSNRRR